MAPTVGYVLDNGAYTIKVGLSNSTAPKIIPNCIMKAKSERRRLFVGDQLKECRDASGLYYILGYQKGYLVNWDIQKTVWDYVFSQECCPGNFSETPLILTEPLFNFTPIQEGLTEIFFEEYECQNLLKTNATDLCAYKYHKTNNSLCCIVVDMGYSFTHIVPYIKGKKYMEGIRRIDVGGKLLTNHLKEIISYRQLNVMDETYVVNQVKEDACFMSQHFMDDMREAKKRGAENTIVRDYVLPDYTTIRRGYIQDTKEKIGADQQSLVLSNERFTIPEILIHPSDIGIQQMGVPEAIINSAYSCPEETLPHLLANVLVVGGSSLFPGTRARLHKELRSLAPDDIQVNVTIPEDPISYAWQGGTKLATDPQFLSMCIKRRDYEEHGSSIGVSDRSE